MVNASDPSRTFSAAGGSSWGAIFAGTAIAIVVSLVLGMLGLALGMSIIEPGDGGAPVTAISIGAGIYAAISGIIALFAGGYTSGYLSTDQRSRAPALHGLTTWALVSILNFAVVTGVTAGVVGGIGKAVTGGLEALGEAGSTFAAPLTRSLTERMEQADIDLDLGELRQDIREILSGMDPALQPEQLEKDVEELIDSAEQAAGEVARNPAAAEEAVQRVFDRIQDKMQEKISAADREALVSILVSRTEMSEAEARETLDNWQETYQEAYEDARQELAEVQEEAAEAAREYTDAMMDAVSAAAWWGFFLLILDGIAAAFGASVGARRAISNGQY